MAERVSCRCFAKVNLALAVSRRIGGQGPWADYHRIASWMHAIELWDDLVIERAEGAPGSNAERMTLEPAPDAPVTIPGRELIDWPVSADLSLEAVRAMERYTGRELPVSITLGKRIPAAGGLGGGSADAGKVLTALRDLFGLGLDDEMLIDIAMGVGSDVCFFTDGGVAPDAPVRPAMVELFGNRVTRIGRSAGELILIVPGKGCPTGAVYKAYDGSGVRLPPGSFDKDAILAAAEAGRCENDLLVNELTEAALEVGEGLRELRDALEDAASGGAGDRRVHVTGSGSTMFILRQPGDPEDLLDRLRAAAGDQPVALLETRLV